MPDDAVGETSTGEAIALLLLFLVGAVFFVKPVMATTGEFVDFLEAFPDPATLGPYGNVFAAIAMLLGGGGFARNKL